MTRGIHRHGGTRGVALIELAVALPVLVALVVGSADFARVLYYAIEVTNAARAGAQYGSYSDGHALQAAQIQAAAVAAAPNIGVATSDVTVGAPSCVCATSDGSGVPWPATGCTSTCLTGHLMESITVTVTKTFTTIARLPGVPNQLTITRSATMRVAL